MPRADIPRDLATVAVEATHEFKTPRGAIRRELEPSSREAIYLSEVVSATNRGYEPWELHSELVLVCPEVRKRALELLLEPDTDAFLARPRETPLLLASMLDDGQCPKTLRAAVVAYTVWRLLETARIAFF